MTLDPYAYQSREQVQAANERRYRWWGWRRRVGRLLWPFRR